jgi:hypothetical protein
MRNKSVALSFALAAIVIGGASEIASADTAYGRQCNRVLAKRAITGRVGGTGHVCAASAGIAEDNRPAGLDYSPRFPPKYVDGVAVTGCIRYDFPLNRNWLLAAIDVTAKPVSNACNASPCQHPYCGTGGNFVVFRSDSYGRGWKHVKAVTVTTQNYSEYKVLLDQPAPMVMICRAGDGPARDDVFIDAVKGCAVQP